MDNLEIFSSAQAVTKHPVLARCLETRRNYYACLYGLAEGGQWSKTEREYIQVQLTYYRQILCGEGLREGICAYYSALQNDLYLLPLDIAAVVGYRKQTLRWDILSSMTAQMQRELVLSDQEKWFLGLEFSAMLGDRDAWQSVREDPRMKEFRKYLDLVGKNRAFIHRTPYNLLLTATMSAGKSTLLNALAGKRIGLTQNMAATCTVHTVLSKSFDDGITTRYDGSLSMEATQAELLQESVRDGTRRILVSTYFSGTLGGQRLTVFDSPGINFSGDESHARITRELIAEKKHHLLIYVLNATQLGTDDDYAHLTYVAKTLEDERVLFVLNKIDQLSFEDGALSELIARQREILKGCGFPEPVICPICARAAYLAKKSRTESLSRLERRELEHCIDRFEQGSLSAYCEEELGCTHLPLTGNEAENLCRNCGFTYMEHMILGYKRRDIP